MAEQRPLEYYLDSPEQLLEEFVHTDLPDKPWLPQPFIPYMLSAYVPQELDQISKIIIHFSKPITEKQQSRLQQGVWQYLDAFLRQKEDEYQQFKRDRLRFTLYGATMLGIFISLYILATKEDPLINLGPFSEALIVLGWVGMWKPAEMFLFDWVPLVREMKTIKKLRAIPISFTV